LTTKKRFVVFLLLLFSLFSLLLFVPGVFLSSDKKHLWMFRPRPRDDRPRPRPRDRRKEDEGKEEPKARLDFFASLPNVPEMDICTDDANEDERFLHFGERRRTFEGIL
jgi:hypothetical protein